MTRKWYFISIVRSYNHAKKTSIINLKPFGIMESIDILFSFRRLFNETMMPINGKMPNSLSFRCLSRNGESDVDL